MGTRGQPIVELIDVKLTKDKKGFGLKFHGMARRVPSPTAYFSYPPINPDWNLNFNTRKQQCLSLLTGCSSMKELKQIHAHILSSELHKDGYLTSEILRFCALSPFGSLDYARSVLIRAFNLINSSWNHVIRAYSLSDSPREAITLFIDMRRHGITGNELTFPFLFKACASLSAFKEGKQIQVAVVKSGVYSNVYVQNSMIHFYASCQQIYDARKVFDMMTDRSVVSWNSIITGCVENSCLHDSICYFSQMIGCGFEPDATTMVILLSACAELGNLSLGKWVHCQVIEKGLTIGCQLGTALVDMYAKCGAVYCARLVFERMLDRNVWTWSAMILGLAQHGLAKEALELFTEMSKFSIHPNYVTFLGLLCACSHARLVDKGYRFFYDMVHVHGIEPKMIHYGAMVDILGRSGHLEEAYNFITNMHIEPDPIVWRTLLSACNIHDVNSNSEVRAKVRSRLLELEPRRVGNFVMVANMCAEVGLWEEAASVRRKMKERGLKKMAGESCVELGGSLQKFFSGDDLRVDNEGIYQMLEGLFLQMKNSNSGI